MVFNPLFLQVVNNQESPSLSKTQKLTGPSYLFSDIIKVHLDKNETGSIAQGGEAAKDNNLLSSIISVLSGNNTQAQIQNAETLVPASALKLGQLNLPAAADLSEKDLAGQSETAGIGDMNSLLVGNSELVNFINSLLTNQQFNGKISIVEAGSEGTVPAENLNASQVLNLLKDGSTIAVENSASQSNNGLMITLVELSGNAASSSGGNVASAGALQAMLASPNAAAENGGAQVLEPMYKLNFSLVNNPETAGTLIDTQKPIIKFPFNSAPDQEAGSFKFTPEMSLVNKTLQADKIISGKNAADGTQGNFAPGDLTAPAETSGLTASAAGGKIPQAGSAAIQGSAAPEAAALGEMTQTVQVTDTEINGAETLAGVKIENPLKGDLLKEAEIKAGKFGKIERLKTDPALQVKDTSEPSIRKQELPASDALTPEQNKTQKSDESINKKTAEDQAQKTSDVNAAAQKEKDLKLSPGAKQDASVQAADKTETKDAPKSEVNSSSKDSQQGQSPAKEQGSAEQNHKSQETAAPTGEHTEAKGKTQEDHSFNIGNLSKTNESSFAMKKASDGGIFGEAAKTVKAAEVMKEISKFIQQGDRSSITLKIDPENLGSVKIALDLADKVVHANIEVENEAARRLMENNLNQLYNSLSQNGLQLNSINISLANSEQKQGKMPNQKRRASAGDGNKDSDDIEGIRQKQMGYNTYDYLI